MVRVAGKNCVLDGGEGRKSPPLPFIEVTEDEARALIGTGNAVLVDGDALGAEWAEAEQAASEAAQAELAASVTEPVVEAPAPAAEAAPAVEPVNEATTDSAPAPSADGAGEADAASERRQAIVDAFDLLEEGHFVRTGLRAGKPKLNAVEDITEIRDLTAAEIDALFDSRDGA